MEDNYWGLISNSDLKFQFHEGVPYRVLKLKFLTVFIVAIKLTLYRVLNVYCGSICVSLSRQVMSHGWCMS